MTFPADNLYPGDTVFPGDGPNSGANPVTLFLATVAEHSTANAAPAGIPPNAVFFTPGPSHSQSAASAQVSQPTPTVPLATAQAHATTRLRVRSIPDLDVSDAPLALLAQGPLLPRRPDGRSQRTARRQQRRGGRHTDVTSHWHGRAKPLEPGDEVLKFHVRAGRDKGTLRFPLDNVVTAANWDDTGLVMTGSISIKRIQGETYDFGHGDMVVCTIRSDTNDRKAKELWSMRINDSDESAANGDLTFSLVSPIDFLQRSKDDWKFKKEKDGHHKDGWTADEIARNVAHRYDFKIGGLATPPHKITNLVKESASPIDIITEAYKQATKNELKKKYVMEYRAGRLYVRPLRYARYMYQLGKNLIDASYQKSLKSDFATAVTVRGTADTKNDDDSKGKGEIEERVEAKPKVKRYGLIHRVIQESELKDAAQARKFGRRELRDVAKRDKTLSLEVPGIPRLRRGDACRVRLPDMGLKKICFVKTVSHSLSAGSLTSSVELDFEDELAEMKKCLEKCLKAQKRDREDPEDCDCSAVKEEAKKKDDDKKPPRNKDDQRR
jgi:hypothetical protein